MLKTPLLSPAPTDKVQGMRQSHQLGPWHVNYISAAWSNHGMAGARSSTMGQAPGVTLPASKSLGRHVYLRLKRPSKRGETNRRASTSVEWKYRGGSVAVCPRMCNGPFRVSEDYAALSASKLRMTFGLRSMA